MKKFLMLFLIGAGLSVSAQAKDAKCWVVIDDGQGGSHASSCNFRSVGPNGSFEVSAYGRKMLVPLFKIRTATVHINLSDPNSGTLYFNGNTRKPIRVTRVGACWGESDTTNTVCAYAK